MSKLSSRLLALLVVLVMGAATAVIIWYTVDMPSLQARIADKNESLDTALGRERKQQAEYEKAVADVAAANEKLSSLQAEAESAAAGADAQKAERKNLKNQVQELKDKLAALQAAQGVGSDEQ